MSNFLELLQEFWSWCPIQVKAGMAAFAPVFLFAPEPHALWAIGAAGLAAILSTPGVSLYSNGVMRNLTGRGETMTKFDALMPLAPMPRVQPLQRPAPQPTNKVEALMLAELETINKMLAAHRIEARVTAKRTLCVQTGFIAYGLQIKPGEKMAKIEAILRELSDALATVRRRAGVVAMVPVRFTTSPHPALETPHPQPKVLTWRLEDYQTTPAHTMLLGKSYIAGPQVEMLAFDNWPHVLVAGITGAGKSVLLQNMLLSLCYATSPDDLKVMLVDLKNEDMAAFADLPHVLRFCGRRDEAIEAIRTVQAEKDARVDDRQRKPYRLVLWVDEIAQLATESAVRDMLGDLGSIGRSKLINIVAATQHPTKEGGLGGLMKANFPVRLVGMVAPGQSHVATGRAGAHADLLPGKGAFLKCAGPDVHRFQSFYIDAGGIGYMVRQIQKRWKTRQAAPIVEPVTIATPAPIVDKIDQVADAIKELWAKGASKNAMSKTAFGRPYAGSYATKIDEAIKRLAAST